MIKLSKSALIHVATILLVLLVLAKFISLFIWWYLPSDGIESKIKQSYKHVYQRVDFKNMIEIPKKKVSSKVAQKNTASKTTNITNMILKGLFGNKYQGFAILALKSAKNKTSIVSVGEDYVGYTLKEIMSDGVIFTKSGKEYTLFMATAKGKKKSKSFVKPVEKVFDDNVQKVISKKTIHEYAKDPQKIFKDIVLTEEKDGDNIKGYRVVRMRINSEISKIGLKQDDVIIRANNIDITSYKEVLEIYKNLDKFNTIEIIVLRNNQEKELVYGIN